MDRKKLAILLLVLGIALSVSVWAGNKKKDKHGKKDAAIPQMDERQRALHVLNRLTFGPRPGDVDRVLQMGVDKWTEQQLRPEKIDDSALDARLSPLRTLRMSNEELVANFPPPQVIKAVAEGRMPLPSDPAKRAVYQQQVERYEQRQENKADKAGPNAAPPDAADDKMMSDDQRAARREARMNAEDNAQRIMALPAEERFKAILEMSPDDRQALARSLPPEQRQNLMEALTPEQRERVMAMVNPQQVVVTELGQGKILRAAYSERQLQEVMTDFWYNHFNVFVGKGPDRYLITSYEREVIRPHALGKFKDLLVATAKSPAMLFYLDNWQSVGPDSDFAQGRRPGGFNRGRNRPTGPRQVIRRGRLGGGLGRQPGNPPQQNPQPRLANNQQTKPGLNENYARELMELHTLGVDGGYTQKDVTEVAKVFTGWSIREPRRGGDFDFNVRRHEPGAKHVLGKTIKESGESEGMEVLDLLAHHPSTAHFISKKLAMRFVADDPPPALVDRMAETFLKTDGDIREVLRTMLASPEFWQPQMYRAKVKTPFEFVVSAIRASGADVHTAMPLVQTLNQMGMPLYGAQPPTGYSMKAETWVNSAALLNRMNFALRFASGRMPGVGFNPEQMLGASATPGDPDQALALLENALLAGDLSKQTHDTIRKQLTDPQVTGRVLDDPNRPPNLGVIAGLILGSPEFQRR